MDVHIPRAITNGLRLHGIDVITAQEDNANTFSDLELLERATSLDRVLFTFDDDLLAEAANHQKNGALFSGVIFAYPLRISIGLCVSNLHLIAQAADPEDLANKVEFLPV